MADQQTQHTQQTQQPQHSYPANHPSARKSASPPAAQPDPRTHEPKSPVRRTQPRSRPTPSARQHPPEICRRETKRSETTQKQNGKPKARTGNIGTSESAFSHGPAAWDGPAGSLACAFMKVHMWTCASALQPSLNLLGWLERKGEGLGRRYRCCR